jgi:thiamine-phosphate diphosphorylase
MKTVEVDYSLYLVTDSTAAILGNKDLVAMVEAALAGGVTVVQYRDKVGDTAELVSTARKLHAVTRKYSVPLLINDRVDVALAVGCEGVHIGQDDLGTAQCAPNETLVDLCRSQKCSTPSRQFVDHWCDSVFHRRSQESLQ